MPFRHDHDRRPWDDARLAFRPDVDAWFESSVAGDGAGIEGAEAAALQGRLAALGAAFRLDRLYAVRDARALPLRRALDRVRRGRRFLDALYRPDDKYRVPEHPDTVVCRCEDVTAGQIRATVALGVSGPQVKTFLRCGMGPCQGRLCGLTVTELIAAERGVSPAEVGYYRLRAPVRPLRLGELASLPHTEAAHLAVVGDAAGFTPSPHSPLSE